MFATMTDTLPNLSDIVTAAELCHLNVFGMTLPKVDDPVPKGTQSIILLGPHEPGFWDHVRAEPEFGDRQPDPMDRWSARVIGALAIRLGGHALFPFGGPPYMPFIDWALRSGRAWSSPVQLLVHDTAGLMVSYRGAIALRFSIQPPAAGPRPCDSCAEQPCMTACPVQALTSQAYDLRACHDFLDTSRGLDCLQNGCAARRSCPVSQTYGRLAGQSAHHMKAFHP